MPVLDCDRPNPIASRLQTMGRFSAFSLVIAACFVHASSSRAQPMDPVLDRLCLTDASDPTSFCTDPVNGANLPDTENYSRLMQQLATVAAAPVLTPARTMGYRHFQLSIDESITNISGNAAAYWRRGTEGRTVDPGSPEAPLLFANGNDEVDANMSFTRVTIRKGLPLGFELGASAGHLRNTSLWLWNFEVKWALFEGYRRRFPGWVPDLAVRGTVTAMTGTRGYTMTVPTFDVILSKPIVIGRTIRVSPFVAGQMIWTIVDSEIIDLTPGNIMDDTFTVFPTLRAFHPRIAAGLELRASYFVASGAFHYDITDPGGGDIAANQPSQWSAAASVGIIY
jgi:hypothetical protein